MIELLESQKTLMKGMKFIDLFAGIGAFRTALESFGAECVFSSEWDKDAQKTYEMNYGDCPAGDITKIEAKDIPAHDILCAGFPCQPFSISGKMLGFKDTRGTLFFDVARIAEFRKPSILLLENVKNFARHDNGRTMRIVLDTLNGLGYDANYGIYNAADYGVPQKRERIFFVCFRKEMEAGEFKQPLAVPLQRHVEDVLESAEETARLAVVRSDVKMNGKPEQHSSSPVRIGIVNKGGQGERIYSVKGAAVTLSAYGGGVGSKTGLYLADGRIRKLSARECARLDGFPDTFVPHPVERIALKQFGNSIVVDVIQHIVLQMEKEGILPDGWRKACGKDQD